MKAAVAKVRKVTPAQYTAVLKAHGLPANTKPADLPLALLRDAIESTFQYAGWIDDEPTRVAWAKLLGVDVKALEPKLEQAGAAATTQTSGVRKSRKKGRAA